MIKYMEITISNILAILTILTVCFIAYNVTGDVTISKYVTTIYMYIGLGLLLMAYIWTIVDKNPEIYEKYIRGNFVGTTIIFFASFFAILLIPTKHNIIKHAMWLIFMLITGFMVYPIYKKNVDNNKLRSILITLLTIIVVMTYVAYTTPEKIIESFRAPLMYGLCALIIAELIDLLFFTREGDFMTRFKIYSWAATIIFTLMLAVTTKDIWTKSKQIINKCNGETQMDCVDYPRDSLTGYLNIVNLFNGISGVSQ